jgi:hypothetical protein
LTAARPKAQSVTHARKAGRTTRGAPRAASRKGSRPVDTTAVRIWAQEQGIDIKERGRVPASVVAQYKAATGR